MVGNADGRFVVWEWLQQNTEAMAPPARVCVCRTGLGCTLGGLGTGSTSTSCIHTFQRQERAISLHWHHVF